MASYHKWDVKNGFAFVLQFFSLISDGLSGVLCTWEFSYKRTLLSMKADLSATNCCGLTSLNQNMNVDLLKIVHLSK